MGALLTVCVIVAVLGLLLIILSVVPVTSVHLPNGLGAGIALIVIGVMMAVVVALVGQAPL